ncbi:hypothetical protein O0555_10145 [Brevibacillus laterosporus]|uniref:Non-ribosomal peptide synthetase module n=1 Tax=Brevibacillus laterosporus TaxID=1465 RepID=A0AAP3DG34_BRELA|nr:MULTISPECIES: hypothetical protein [Brevibacillus]ATO48180.1 hypothetical protein BrL25_03075 [Brevibacillus laterosporus DSM 25]MBG9772505.1 hypothetical protein [Brevibacillus laterosporus]MBG9788330.1 hypothetical protein [Brevibacillus laterosporus]MBG9799924.1 hypothetical protein [Brevibacillus laterosporus]MBG9801844.1 hypothetical protein [Brevibacillus laterosporus]
MAQRLATNYANAFFTMTEQELKQFVQLFAKERVLLMEQIFENGDRDIVIVDGSSEIHLAFQKFEKHFICDSSYTIKDISLANVMRKAMKAFKGHAVVHRIYENFTIIYHYDEGSVTKIEEVNDTEESVIFEQDGASYAKELQHLYAQTSSEQEITQLREETDRLLDLRNWVGIHKPDTVSIIDQKLSAVSHRLFVLEA